MATIRKDQIKLIHALRRQICMAEEDYRANLFTTYGTESCIALSESDADHLIYTMRSQLPQEKRKTRVQIRGHGSSVSGTLRYDELAGRGPEWATPAQLRLIEAEWAKVTVAKGATARDKALQSFIFNRYRYTSMAMVEKKNVNKIVTTIRAMQKQKAVEQQPL